MGDKYTSLELSIKANCMRVLEILDEYSLEDLRDQNYYGHQTPSIEIKQRMTQLRKDTLKADKIINRTY